MIIKSMARKRPSFNQLIAYMGRDAGASFTRNLYDSGDHPARIARAFERNYGHLTVRKNGNALYHEVIVLPPQPHLSKERQDAILRALAERYCTLRAPDNLAYGRIHQDTDNSHIHLMLSANPARSSRRVRLSKARFAEIQAQLEREARAHFRDLQDQPIYDRTERISKNTKTKTQEHSLIQRTGRRSRKEVVRDHVEAAIQTAKSNADLSYRLRQSGFEIYQRGNRVGVRNLTTGARHRLSTLGLDHTLGELERRWQTERAAPIRKPVSRTPQRTPDASERKPTSQKILKPSPKPERFAPNRDTDGLSQDPRAEELLRQRQAMTTRADRTLRDFDPER